MLVMIKIWILCIVISQGTAEFLRVSCDDYDDMCEGDIGVVVVST